MLIRLELPFTVFLLFCSTCGFGQQTPTPSVSAVAQEFPVTFQENIVAGKTAAGARVQAKLRMATLVHGTVIPQGAVFSGEVVESVAKTKTDPSKLAVRIDSAQWKGGSAGLRIYLVAWFYPSALQAGQDLQYGPQQPASRTWNGMGQYPSDNNKVYQPFPGGGSDSNSSPEASNSVTSAHRVQMKDVQTDRSADGTITLVSSHSNIKLDKTTTYVLANAELLAPAKSAAKK
jgi:hypothetical protein